MELKKYLETTTDRKLTVSKRTGEAKEKNIQVVKRVINLLNYQTHVERNRHKR